ncbi:MAG: aminotransferase class V-fold PLP-dependent enzyme [Planctomycetaceae bacterium]
MLTAAERDRDFPGLRSMTYLNTAAEGIPPRAVGEALQQYFADKLLGMDGRSPHAAQALAARERLAGFYGLSVEEVAICSCSSEAYNLAALALRLRAGDEVVINDLDFPAGATPWLQPECPATVKLWRSREGRLDTADLVPLLSPRTRFVNTSLVSFYNGYKVDLPGVLAAVRRHSPALLGVDVTQALGRVPLELAGVDLVISSTHKWILASHGGGLVGVPKQRAAEWTVPAGGWLHLKDPFGPHRFEPAESLPGAAGFAVGMPNYPAIYCIRAALDYLAGVGVEQIAAVADPLVAQCLEGLARLPVELITPRDPGAVAGIVALRHPRAEELNRRLRARDVHLMYHAGRIRAAWHGYNTPADVDRFLTELSHALESL